ncbi:uncharacterized protein LOC117101620 [Anneissia japonica]|uniref:uncharacterized protein LOC117101620 n=1 Tax=Anneissia japonica TaxID=1529436 RepID=UPI0014257527|nr:uncharacterized protein LOC117101620 [Anneissia japonica]
MSNQSNIQEIIETAVLAAIRTSSEEHTTPTTNRPPPTISDNNVGGTGGSSNSRPTNDVEAPTPRPRVSNVTLPGGGKKLKQPSVSSHFRWGGAEVLSTIGQNCLYVMCAEQYGITYENFYEQVEDEVEIHPPPKKSRIIPLDSSDDDDLPEISLDDPGRSVATGRTLPLNATEEGTGSSSSGQRTASNITHQASASTSTSTCQTTASAARQHYQ